jgi:uncharacterized protein (TIRG00374 family)
MRWRHVLLVVVTVVAFAFVIPVLIEVYGSLGDVLDLSPWWLAAIVAAVTVQLVANFELHRIMLRTTKWLDVGAPVLAGNAASHLMPGGGAVGAGVEARMLATAGFAPASIATALAAIAMIGAVSGYVVLPLVVLASSAAGSDVDSRLLGGMWVGAFVLLTILIVVGIAAVRDRPWRTVARAVSWVQRRFGRRTDAHDLERRLLHERDETVTTLRGRPVQVLLVDVVRASADFGALYCALRATGAPVNPAAALAAFIVSNLAGLIPLTPGGLGFVEAGLAGVLIVAGAPSEQASLTVATYRLAATWLPCITGIAALGLFHRRHREESVRELLATRRARSQDSDALRGTRPTAASHTGSASPPPPDR